MDKKIILFDFDKTISDTNGFVEKFCFELNRLFSISEEVVLTTLKEYTSRLESTTDFRPKDFVVEINKKSGVKTNSLEEVIFDPKNHPLFEETFGVLTELFKNNVLGIFSEGFENWQKKKIQLEGIWNFFDPKLMIIERRKLLPESINKIPNGAIVVDDKKEVIETLASARPDLKLVWINRKDEDKLETSQITTIKRLDDLLKI